MIVIHNGDIEAGIAAFSEQSKPILKEYARHRFYSPDAKRHHKSPMKSAGRDSKGRMKQR